MESDDDYQSFSPSSESSPPVHLSKLKRLKKKSVADLPPPKSIDDDLIPFTVDFSKIEALESSRTIIFDDSEEQLLSQSPEGFRDEELRSGFNELSVGERCGEAERVKEFDDVMADEDLDERIADLKIEKLEKKRSSEGRSNEKGEKMKKFKSILPLPSVDFAKLEALESSKTVGFDDSDDSLQSQSPSESFNDKDEPDNADEVPRPARRVLEFDDEVGGDRVDQGEKKEEKLREIKSEKKRSSEGEYKEKKEKNKRVKSSSDEAKVKPSHKRREEKERKAHLEQLHAESQRLLRETRGAGFKPVPLVQKPISSILQKIRQRKLEVSKKICLLNNSVSTSENNDSVTEAMMNTDSDKVSTKEGAEDNLLDRAQVVANTVEGCENSESSLDADIFKEFRSHSCHKNDKPQMALAEESTPTFRAPVDDTQDLFGDSEISDDKDDKLSNQNCTPLEEVLAPSLLTMNLQIDSVPQDDDISSDEEDNDKENLDPLTHKPVDVYSSPKGDPVKAFVDDEAEEEDDSDHDLRFQENDEDEGNEDFEDLNDLIVIGYEEKSVDNERRNELHQKWLEQQDAAGTDNLMQRLGCGPKMEKTLFDVEDGSDDDEEESGDDEKDVGQTKTARMNTRKAKQMIAHMFVDKEDGFVSSDDEETEKRFVKQRLLDKAGDQASLISPAEDASSREVFGLIKKLNNAPVAKKKQKAPSFFDTLVTGGSSNSSLKSSFLGRVSNHSLPSNKQRRSTTRSFIFGRDDSNSRSSISISEDSSDAASLVPKENRPMRNVTPKFSSSQAKSITQSTQIVAEKASGTSLIEILKRSSMQSNTCNQDTMVGLTQTAFSAFKIPQKAIKMEGRTKF